MWFHHLIDIIYERREKRRGQSLVTYGDTDTISSSLRTKYDCTGECTGDFCGYDESSELAMMQKKEESDAQMRREER